MTIRLYWMGGNRGEVNFGDSISPLIVEMMAGKPVRYAPPEMCDLAAVGSIIDKVAQKRWKRLARLRLDPVRVWGSGAFGTTPLSRFGLSPVAVRGLMTAKALGLPDGFPVGDPGLLVDRFGTRREKRYRWGIIPHVADRDVPLVHGICAENPDALFIDLAAPDLMETLCKIQSCDFIASSSLHGLVTADAFGIPSVWLRVSDNLYGGDWKFLDYFSAVGRAEVAGITPVAPLRLETLEQSATCADTHILAQRRAGLERAFKTLGY